MFTPAIFLIWLAHAMGWGLLALFVAGYEAERLWRLRAEPIWARVADLAVRGLPFLLPLIPTLVQSAGLEGAFFYYGDDLVKRKLMNLVAVLRGTSPLIDIGTPVALAIMTAPLIWARLLRIDARAAAAGLTVLLASFAIPSVLLDSWAADQRIVPYAAIMLALGFRWMGGTRGAAGLAACAAALFGLRTAVIAADWRVRDIAYTSHLFALDHVPVGARIQAVALGDSCHGAWRSSTTYALPGMAIVRRDALVNTEWRVPGAALLRVIYPWPDALRYDRSQIVVGYDCQGRQPAPLLDHLAALPRDKVGYLWVLETRGEAQALPGLTPVFADDNSALYPLR